LLRFILVALAAFAALGCGLMLSSAHSQAPAAAIAGEWAGKYVCGQGITALRLNVADAGRGVISATFTFGPLPENPDVPRGAYRMEGSFDAKTRKMQLRGVKWIDAPNGYVMVDLDGRLDADGDRISGLVPEWPGCTVFEVSRPPLLIS
jgi:hypothetical protein